jgi:hypothetical protein
MSYYPPTEEELAAIHRLREQLLASEYAETAAKFTDTTILRFYRGRKLDEEKAFRALVRFIQWRADNEVDTIEQRTSQFEKELNSGKIIPFGQDKLGHPTVFINARKHNKNARDLDEIRQLIIYSLENVLKRTNPENERIVIVFDLKGFTLNCMDYDAVKVLVNILSFNYPETLEVAFIINAPFLFSACWGMIRPWLDPVTTSKVMFTKPDALKQYFTEENLLQDTD